MCIQVKERKQGSLWESMLKQKRIETETENPFGMPGNQATMYLRGSESPCIYCYLWVKLMIVANRGDRNEVPVSHCPVSLKQYHWLTAQDLW